MKIISIVLLLMFMFVMMAAPNPAKAQADVSKTITQESFEIDFLPENYPCLTEAIHVSATYEFTFMSNFGPSGDFHYNVHQRRVRGTGIGLTTGTVYQFSGPFHQNINGWADVGSPVELTFTNHNHLVGQGQAQNFHEVDQFHITFDPSTGNWKKSSGNHIIVCN